MNYMFSDDFHKTLGEFYAFWVGLESTIEYEIGKLLGLKPIKTHAIVAGMEFGRKASLFRILIEQEDHKHKTEVRQLLDRIQNEAKRNIFTHSLLYSDENKVEFIYRKVQGNRFEVSIASFNENEFASHLKDIIDIANRMAELLDIDQDDYVAFCEAAHNAAKSA